MTALVKMGQPAALVGWPFSLKAAPFQASEMPECGGDFFTASLFETTSGEVWKWIAR